MQVRTQVITDVAKNFQVKVPTVTVTTSDGRNQALQIPTTHDEMMALMSQRDALTEQLDNANDRQQELIEQLKTVPAEAKPGLQAQLSALTEQIVSLQGDLSRISREMSQASPALMAMTHEDANEDQPGTFQEGVFLGGAGVFLGMTVLLLLGRWIWKRFIRDDVPTGRALPAADSERLQRVEHGMEAMAIEIERISEGQRYVTRLMSEQRGAESTPR
ncbi:MAG TPA: hypothetical protein VJ852_00660 [Gemmatimonadaceae bacterium]|nr:hypothetical protein [Gemmatimonadaceae bacterium]